MEGRAFILGRNGFYNKAVEILKKYNIHQIYFVFLFKNETEEEMKNSLLNLIKKGDQKDLDSYMTNNQIIYINESYLENKEKKDKLLFFLSNSIYKSFVCLKVFENLKMPVYAKIKNIAEIAFESQKDSDIVVDDKEEASIVSPFFNRFKKYFDGNIYYKGDNCFQAKNFYDEKSEILDRIKFIKIFQKFTKENFSDSNSTRFNCEIL